MSRHAQALGYDALILFLDERVLRLASHAADSAFVSRESQKIVKLVEATLSIRPIPIVSFIHRSIYLRCPSPPLRKASLSCTCTDRIILRHRGQVDARFRGKSEYNPSKSLISPQIHL